MIISLEFEDCRRVVPTAAKKLKNSKSENGKKIYINPDLTIAERKRDYELRQELRKRRNEGEENIVIIICWKNSRKE